MSDIQAIRERHDSMQRTKDFSIGFFADDAFDDAHTDRAFLLSALSAAEARAEAAEEKNEEFLLILCDVVWRDATEGACGWPDTDHRRQMIEEARAAYSATRNLKGTTDGR